MEEVNCDVISQNNRHPEQKVIAYAAETREGSGPQSETQLLSDCSRLFQQGRNIEE
jgi:hypothetical protein